VHHDCIRTRSSCYYLYLRIYQKLWNQKNKLVTYIKHTKKTVSNIVLHKKILTIKQKQYTTQIMSWKSVIILKRKLVCGAGVDFRKSLVLNSHSKIRTAWFVATLRKSSTFFYKAWNFHSCLKYWDLNLHLTTGRTFSSLNFYRRYLQQKAFFKRLISFLHIFFKENQKNSFHEIILNLLFHCKKEHLARNIATKTAVISHSFTYIYILRGESSKELKWRDIT
jgi:hypothetical protein